MGMSYRHAWILLDELNRSFEEPVILSAMGGPRGGGAKLTSGLRRHPMVLDLYASAPVRSSCHGCSTASRVAAMKLGPALAAGCTMHMTR